MGVLPRSLGAQKSNLFPKILTISHFETQDTWFVVGIFGAAGGW